MTDLADPKCPHCHGRGYRIEGVDALAVAAPCVCVKTCPRCDDSGQVMVDIKGLMRAARCRCRKLPDRLRLFNDAQIPARHATSSFATFRPSEGQGEPWNLARRWSKDYKPGQPNPGLVFCGPVGTGKTHLMVGMLRDLMFRHGVSTRFVEFTHLLADLKEGFEKGRSGGRLLGPLARVQVLAIDELGKGRKTDWEQAIVDELISKRYNSRQTLVATTNYGIGRSRSGGGPDSGGRTGNLALPPGAQEPLVDRVGGRVYSRLREMCSFVPVSGPDYRSRAERLGSGG